MKNNGSNPATTAFYHQPHADVDVEYKPVSEESDAASKGVKDLAKFEYRFLDQDGDTKISRHGPNFNVKVLEVGPSRKAAKRYGLSTRISHQTDMSLGNSTGIPSGTYRLFVPRTSHGKNRKEKVRQGSGDDLIPKSSIASESQEPVNIEEDVVETLAALPTATEPKETPDHDFHQQLFDAIYL